MAVTLTNDDDATVTGLANGDYVVKGEDITFTVSAASNMEIDTVTYTVDSNSPVEITASGSSYTVPGTATENATSLTVTINQVGGYDGETGSFNINVTNGSGGSDPYTGDADVDEIVVGLAENSYFDPGEDVTFSVVAPEGYYVQYVAWSYGNASGTMYPTEAEDGSYTISASALAENTAENPKLVIGVRLHENPEITFTGSAASDVLVNDSTVSSGTVSVEYGGSITFSVPTGTSVSASGTDMTRSDGATGYTNWTISDVTADITITVGTAR